MILLLLDYYCGLLNNYFIKDPSKDIYKGKFEIVDGIINLDFLCDNQYFRICNSMFNDGIYKYTESLTLIDEIFEGFIWAMYVPNEFLDAVVMAENYTTKNPVNNFKSESFGGYTYTKDNKSDSSPLGYLPPNIFYKLNKFKKMRSI